MSSELQPGASPRELQFAPTGESEDQVLDYTQSVRKRIVKEIVADGTIPVEDRGVMNVLLQTLDGMDRAALGKKRIKVEEKANQNAEAASGLISQLLQRVTPSQNPFVQAEGGVVDVSSRVIPTLPDSVPPPHLVEGETATVAPQQSYETFVAQHQPSAQ